MSGRKLSLHFLIGLLILMPASAMAEALSSTQIENLIRSARPLTQLEDKYDLPEINNPENTPIGPMSDALNNIKGYKAYGDFIAIIKKSGFSSAEEWANVGDRVIRAYLALSINTKEVQSQMAEAMKQLESNPYITAEQKEMMRQQMKKSLPGGNGKNYSSPEDMKVVRPYLKQLEKAFEAEH